MLARNIFAAGAGKTGIEIQNGQTRVFHTKKKKKKKHYHTKRKRNNWLDILKKCHVFFLF